MKKYKIFSWQMLGYEFRSTIGNPYVHIFGVGMPILMMVVISRAVAAEVTDAVIFSEMATSLFLGIGTLIPLANLLMGYGVEHAQQLEKGIPQRMELFGIRKSVTLCNRVLAEIIFMFIAFCIYFAVGYALMDIKTPKFTGVALYIVCIAALSIILFCMAYAIAELLRKFSPAFCVLMLLYFAIMICCGMMGITYDNMPVVMQHIAKLLPVTYINRDFYTVWGGENYNFMPMVQSYLLLAAVSGILLFISIKRTARKLH